MDYRTDAEVLIDLLRGLAQDITDEINLAERDDTKNNVANDIRAMAGAQLVLIEQYFQAMKQANAEAHGDLWAITQRFGIDMDREKYDRLFPAETNGRLAPPLRRVFNPNIVENTVAAVA